MRDESRTGVKPHHVARPIANATFLGADMLADVECDNGVTLRVRIRPGVVVGDRVMVGIADEGIWAIPEAAGEPGA